MKITNIILLFLLIFLFIIPLASAPISPKENISPDKILLKSREFIPDKGLHVNGIGKTHFLIQLENFPTKEEREKLEEAGIKLLDYIPNKVWFESISKITL